MNTTTSDNSPTATRAGGLEESTERRRKHRHTTIAAAAILTAALLTGCEDEYADDRKVDIQRMHFCVAHGGSYQSQSNGNSWRCEIHKNGKTTNIDVSTR
jgi:hypothetical protein